MTEQLFIGLIIGFVVGGAFGAFCLALVVAGRDTPYFPTVKMTVLDSGNPGAGVAVGQRQDGNDFVAHHPV